MLPEALYYGYLPRTVKDNPLNNTHMHIHCRNKLSTTQFDPSLSVTVAALYDWRESSSSVLYL